VQFKKAVRVNDVTKAHANAAILDFSNFSLQPKNPWILKHPRHFHDGFCCNSVALSLNQVFKGANHSGCQQVV